jgi:acetyl esterase/lipase
MRPLRSTARAADHGVAAAVGVLLVAAFLIASRPAHAAASDAARVLRRTVRAAAAAPVLDPPPGTYRDTVAVTVSCPTAGATIHVTTDGSEPTSASPAWDGLSIVVANHVAGGDDPDPADANVPLATVSARIRAIAVRPGLAASAETGGGYVIDRVDSTFDIPYDDPPAAGGGKHLLDVYQPHGRAGTAVVLFIHGGAWTQGDKNIYLELGNVLAGHHGLTTVVANYELSAPPWYAVHPVHVSDAARALAWVHRHIAEYGGDPAAIYLFGQSAGGHLVSLLASDPTYLAAEGLDSSLIRGVVTMSGAYDLAALAAWPGNQRGLSAVEVLGYRTLFLSVFGGFDAASLAAASPATWVRTSMPPFRVIYAWEDMPGFPEEAVAFHSLVTALGQPYADLVELEESDIPAEVLALGLGGHYEEIYAINTRDHDSVSTRAVVDFIAAH